MFRVTGRLAVPLAEVAEILQGDVIPCQVKETVKKHGAVAGGKDETVPVRPQGIGGIVFEMPGPEDETQGGRSHGEARVARPGPLNRVHGEKTDGVDAFL